MKRSVLILSLCLASYNAVLADKDHDHGHGSDNKRSHEAHVHGSGTLSLVAMDNQLMIEMEIPGFDIVGFEHQPSTDEQKQRVKTAIELLQSSESNISFPDDATCKADGAGKVETALDSKDHHDKDHHDEHHADRSEHSEFHIIYNFTCEDMRELTYVEILSFGPLSGCPVSALPPPLTLLSPPPQPPWPHYDYHYYHHHHHFGY